MAEKNKLDSALIDVTKQLAHEKSVIKGSGYRITVLTDRLIRVETSATDNYISMTLRKPYGLEISKPQNSKSKKTVIK